MAALLGTWCNQYLDVEGNLKVEMTLVIVHRFRDRECTGYSFHAWLDHMLNLHKPDRVNVWLDTRNIFDSTICGFSFNKLYISCESMKALFLQHQVACHNLMVIKPTDPLLMRLISHLKNRFSHTFESYTREDLTRRYRFTLRSLVSPETSLDESC